MKIILSFLLFFFAGFAQINAQEIEIDQASAAEANARAPKIKFLNGDTYNFGTLKQGQKVQHKFEFINTGKEPLIIVYVNPSCGCTIADWPKKPIGAGKKAAISITFDSKEQAGDVSKEVYIQSNAATKGDFTMLYIKGTINK